MQVAQLSIYNRNVPKLDASVTVSNVLGSAAIASCDMYPTLENSPCGSPLMAVSARAPESPNGTSTATTPTTAEMAASVQMARCGVKVSECSMPKCSGTSSSLPME